MRAVGYGRYSDEKQNALSAEDQMFEARAACEAKGWTFIRSYTDEAISGGMIYGRDGFLQMREDAKGKKFDVIVVEDIDRISRNLGDLAKFWELVQYYNIAIYSLASGSFVNQMDVGFKGTMSAQFLKDLSQKTKRGLSAAFRDGRSPGGIGYGYRTTGTSGVQKIDEEEAAVVRKIFQLYCDGNTPRMIAGILNSESIPSPRGGEWNASTINGHRERGFGILRNTLYVGQRTWRRTKKVRDPETGKRIIQATPDEKVVHQVPELRILDQDVWDKAQLRVPNLIRGSFPKRTDYLFSGLMKCGVCGASYTSMGGGKHLKFGCAGRRERANCNNRRMIARSIMDNCVLVALREHLLSEVYLKPAVKAYNAYLSEHLATLETTRPKLEKRLKQILDARRKLLQLLEKGTAAEAVTDRLMELDREEIVIAANLEDTPEPISIDPDAALVAYRSAIDLLLNSTLEGHFVYKREVMTSIRQLVDEVRIYPIDDPEGRDVELVGDIEALIVPTSLGIETMVPRGGTNPLFCIALICPFMTLSP